MQSNHESEDDFRFEDAQNRQFLKILSKNNLLPKQRNHAESEQNGQNLHIILHTKIKKSFLSFISISYNTPHRT